MYINFGLEMKSLSHLPHSFKYLFEIQKVDKEFPIPDGTTPFMFACLHCPITVIEYFIDKQKVDVYK